MKRRELVNELRQRQFQLGHVDASIIEVMSDDDIINSYNQCPCCDEKLCDDPDDLRQIIRQSENADQFINELSKHARFGMLSNYLNNISGLVGSWILDGAFNDYEMGDLIAKAIKEIEKESQVEHLNVIHEN